MKKTIRELHQEVKEAKDRLDLAEEDYKLKKLELNATIDVLKGDSPSFYVHIPDIIELNPNEFKAYVKRRHPDGVINNIDFEKRIVTVYIPAEFQRFVYEDEIGKIERRVSKGATTIDLELLKSIKPSLYEAIVMFEPKVRESVLEKLIEQDDEVYNIIQDVLVSGPTRTSLYLSENKEKNR